MTDAPVKYPEAVTAVHAKVGERRWAKGVFDVEVVGYYYAYGASGQEQFARVLVDPDVNTYDDNQPDVNTRSYRPDQLLTEEEAAHHNIALARWHQQQMGHAQRDLDRATADRAQALQRAVDQVRMVTGQDWGGAAINGHLTSALDSVLRFHESHPADARPPVQHCEGRFIHESHIHSVDGRTYYCGGVS